MGNTFHSIQRKICLSLATAACLVAMVAGQAVAQSADPISTKYIAKDAFMVIALHPSKIAAVGSKDSETNEYVLKTLQKFSGLNIKKLDQIVLQMGAPEEEIDDPGDAFAIVFRFAEDIDIEDIVDKMGSNFDLEKTDLEGQPFYKSGSDDEPCFYFPNKRTMIMAEEPRIKVCANGGGMGDGASIAKKIKSSDHLGISFAFDAENENHQAMMEQVMDELPLSEMGLDAEMIENVSSGDLHFSLKSNKFVSGSLKCKDGETADKLASAAKKSLEEMSESLEQAESEIDQAPPEIAEAAAEIIDLAFKAIENAKVESSGSTVSVNVEVEGGMSKVVDGIAKALEQTFRMLEQFGGGF